MFTSDVLIFESYVKVIKLLRVSVSAKDLHTEVFPNRHL